MRPLSPATLLSFFVVGLLGAAVAQPPSADDPFDPSPRADARDAPVLPPTAVDPFLPEAAGADPFDPPPTRQPAAESGEDEEPTERSATPTLIWASTNASTNRRVRQVLASPVTSSGFDFADSPLEEVVEFFRDEYQIEVQLDLQAIDDLGIRPDEQISCSVRGGRLEAALRLILGQLELTCVPVDGYLLITTEEEADTMLKVAVYPVGDLVLPVGFDALIDVIVGTVASETWAENGGGEAELRPLASGVLIVSQTEAVHHQIAALLEALRRVPADALIDPADLPKPPATEKGRLGGGGFGGGFGGVGGGGGGFGAGFVSEGK